MWPSIIAAKARRALLLLLLSAAALPAWADDADDRFAVAAGHYAARRWKLATEEFRTFLDQYPDHSKAAKGVFLLAEAMLQSGKHEPASKWFREYLHRRPDGEFARAALFRAGEAAYLAGNAEPAKAELVRFRSTYPDDKLNAYVLTYLGDIAMMEDDAPSAADHFRVCLRQFPNGAMQSDCRFGLARALERQGRNEEAERFYEAVAAKSRSPLVDDAQFHLGVLQYTMGKYAEAIETFDAFETRLAASPCRAKARLGRGWALMKLERLDDAKAMFQGLVANAQLGIEAGYWLGMVQRDQGNWAAAAETLLATARAADAVNSKDMRILALRFYAGDALRRSGDVKAAYEQFDRILASDALGETWIDDATYGKIQAALEADDHQTVDRTAAAFDRRCPLSPLKDDVHRLLARSQLKRNDHAAAVDLLEPLVSAGTLDEQGMLDRYLLARAYEGLGRNEDALVVLSPILDSAGGQLLADAQLMQGSLLVATRRYADAVKPLEAFAASRPNGDAAVKGRGTLAICYARTGQCNKAKKLHTELLQERPRHELLATVTEQLAEAAYAANDHRWATELFERLRTVGGSPENELRGLAGLGWSQFKAGKLHEAAATFQRLLEKDPPATTAAEAALVRGRILEQLNMPDAAMLMYDRVIDEHPKSRQHPQALLAAARLRVKLGQLRDATSLYRRLLQQHSDVVQLDLVLYEWAWILHDLGKTAESVELFERLHREHADSRYGADATFRLAQRALAAKDYRRADRLVAEVLAGKPDDRIRENALYLRGQIAAAGQKWQQVGEAFEALLEAFPETSARLVAEFWIAETAYRRKDYAVAGEKFDLLAQHSRRKRDAWLAMVPLRRAQVFAQQQNWTETYAVASKIEADYPNFEQQYEVDYLIGRCLHARADFRGARDAFTKVIRSKAGEKTETAAMAQWMIGETFFHQKNYEAALREYLRLEILYAYPAWQAAALLQAGKCREKLGEWKEASRLYTRLLEVYPNTLFARRAAERLKESPSNEWGSNPPINSLTPEAARIRRR